jgi:hypothetical protein
VLSADLQQVSTLTNVNGLNLRCLELLPDGRLLVGERNRIRVLEGFPAALLGTKPSHKHLGDDVTGRWLAEEEVGKSMATPAGNEMPTMVGVLRDVILARSTCSKLHWCAGVFKASWDRGQEGSAHTHTAGGTHHPIYERAPVPIPPLPLDKSVNTQSSCSTVTSTFGGNP